ncbi:MAG: hypothetical protein M1839_002533 [Geoglossum umbratile]|nr:MAG: hypothetical protein M1839_002533 [Geoglossum umbratile]
MSRGGKLAPEVNRTDTYGVIATTSAPRNSSIFLANSGQYGRFKAPASSRGQKCMLTSSSLGPSQIRQGIANNTKGTAFVVYEDVMDAKQACDKLNGFNFQNRYLVGKLESVIFVTQHYCLALILIEAISASSYAF